MKRIILFLPLLALLFASCEKVVNIDLNESNPRYVIEGEIFQGMDTVRVRVAKTTDYYGKKPQQQIMDAAVTLILSDGTVIPIPHTGNGLYELPGFNAVVGQTYQLKVVAGGQEFTAATTVPSPAPIDSITAEFKQEDFLDEGYEVKAYVTDRVEEQNNYRFIYQINDTLRNRPEDLNVFDDKFNNGKTIIVQPFERFKVNDSVTYQIRTMDRNVYDYFRTLQDLLNNPNGPAPSNPLSNIKGGALGYFGAFSVSKAGVRIKE